MVPLFINVNYRMNAGFSGARKPIPHKNIIPATFPVKIAKLHALRRNKQAPLGFPSWKLFQNPMFILFPSRPSLALYFEAVS